MKKFACIALMVLFCASVYAAEGYLVMEGGVKTITGNYLIINDPHDKPVKDHHFPISAFVQVFDPSGKQIGLAPFANVGYIQKAKIYVLRGKVEKIEVKEMR